MMVISQSFTKNPVPQNSRIRPISQDIPLAPPLDRSAGSSATSAVGPACLGLQRGRRPNQPAAKIPAAFHLGISEKGYGMVWIKT